MVRSSSPSLRHSPGIRLAARFALLLLALRSIVPAGYMPDLGALEAGQVKIVICTPGGFEALFVDKAGKPIDNADTDGPGHAVADDCSFGIASLQTFLAPSADLSLGGAYRGAVVVRAEGRSGPLLRIHGPPLGSRAPPISLA